MIMPFIRLFTIYVVVIVAVVAFFKRDSLMQLSSASFGWPASEQSVSEPDAAAQEPATRAKPAVEAVEAVAEINPVATATPEPAPQTAKTELPAIQMPVADPEDMSGAQDTDQAEIASAEPTAAQPTVADTQTRLTAARKAYWNGDLAGSEALYAALAKTAPNDPDINGEFGNILFAQRRFDEAADAFLVTGKLLVKNGNPQQVQPIIAVLQNIAPQKAATLRALAGN